MQSDGHVLRQGRTIYTGDRRNCDSNSCVCRVVLSILLLTIPVGLFMTERHQYQLELAFTELESKIVQVSTEDMTSYPEANTPVYFTSEYTSSVADPDFQVTINHGLTLNRETQYCQWQEHSSESCDTCTNSEGETYDCNCALTYYYSKNWHNTRIF